MNTDLVIKDLRVSVEDKEILKGLNLRVKPGTIHAIMGPNGSGKSTLAAILAGREGYDITAGQVLYNSSHAISNANTDACPTNDPYQIPLRIYAK